MSSSLSAIRVAIILAVIGVGFLGYQHFAASSSASAQDRAVAYLTQEGEVAARLGHDRYDSFSCDSTTSRPTAAEAARLGDVTLVDCAATTAAGQLAVMCVGVGGKLKGSGVGLISTQSHCADLNQRLFAP
jgi:hypothetical protein